MNDAPQQMNEIHEMNFIRIVTMLNASRVYKKNTCKAPNLPYIQNPEIDGNAKSISKLNVIINITSAFNFNECNYLNKFA